MKIKSMMALLLAVGVLSFGVMRAEDNGEDLAVRAPSTGCRWRLAGKDAPLYIEEETLKTIYAEKFGIEKGKKGKKEEVLPDKCSGCACYEKGNQYSCQCKNVVKAEKDKDGNITEYKLICKNKGIKECKKEQKDREKEGVITLSTGTGGSFFEDKCPDCGHKIDDHCGAKETCTERFEKKEED